MKLQPTTAAIGLLFALTCATAHAEPAGPSFPGNEAVRIVNGKRVVEAPPLTAATQRYIKGGGKLPPPSASGVNGWQEALFSGCEDAVPVFGL